MNFIYPQDVYIPAYLVPFSHISQDNPSENRMHYWIIAELNPRKIRGLLTFEFQNAPSSSFHATELPYLLYSKKSKRAGASDTMG